MLPAPRRMASSVGLASGPPVGRLSYKTIKDNAKNLAHKSSSRRSGNFRLPRARSWVRAAWLKEDIKRKIIGENAARAFPVSTSNSSSAGHCVQGPGIDATLLLPWPLQVRASDFHAVEGSVQRLAKDPYGFFEFAPPAPLDLDLLDRVLVAAPKRQRASTSSCYQRVPSTSVR